MPDNNDLTLEKLLHGGLFSIPRYQRAYAWGKKQLGDFIEDIKAHRGFLPNEKPYFLGTFLLTERDTSHGGAHFSIVDGQQRLTTAVMYVASALRALARQGISVDENIARIFIGLPSCRRLTTIEEDNNFFDHHILGDEAIVSMETPAQEKLHDAKQFFDATFAQCDAGDIERDLTTLRHARVLSYTVKNESEATQIFEFQNDRGKRLTKLEILKSFLMHAAYLYCGNALETENVLKKIQGNFADIYRTIEDYATQPFAPAEDSVLGDHLIAYLPHKKVGDNQDGWDHPKELIRILLQDESRDRADKVSLISNFSHGLLSTYRRVGQILAFRDRCEDLAGLFILGRTAPFWPLLIKCWEHDTSPEHESFQRICALCTRLAFRSSVAHMRSDTGNSYLYNDARDFPRKMDFDRLEQRLSERGDTWWHLKTRFLQGLDDADFYHASRPARYLLWRYENHLRGGDGRNAQHELSWHDMIRKNGEQLQMTIDHIIPQRPSDPDEQAILNRDVTWRGAEAPLPFREACLHRLGNLVLDTRAGNAAKGCRPFNIKTDPSNPTFMKSQAELPTFAPEPGVWDERAIEKRQQALEEFALTL
ncbi:DUF262 domain-containing protein [Gluconacetobacter entanii]|uniref:DUF262 domain-containing protein n=1 Tax=Gluconacetobacter entanii TaxID=108528 RepID=UPI0021BC2144|nr:DUF262 domain-containing HNH endonuclease family protein [Gluconacetobacter entanii]MCW4588424.1 DUF262 domain-containing HNH endonuclease family protein [Gluconacetobacter entanii]